MNTVLNVFLGLLVFYMWYLSGIVGIGLFAAAIEPATVSEEVWRRRKRLFLFLALFGPAIYVLFVLWMALSIVVGLLFFEEKVGVFNLSFDWITLGFKDPDKEDAKREMDFEEQV